jgi:hypothetical protein
MTAAPQNQNQHQSPLISTAARREALSVLADYFCLNGKQAAELLGTSLRNIQRHYVSLESCGLVTSIRYNPEEHTKGAIPLAYGLTDRGVRKAFDEGFSTDSTKSFDAWSKRTIEHEIMISTFHLELAKLAGEKGWALRWWQRGLNKKPVFPDAVLSINGHFFMLEIERAKLGDYIDGTPSIIRKLADYWDYYDSDDCESDFEFRKFHALTVMRTAERAQNLVHMLQKPHHLPALKRDIPPLNKATFLLSHEKDPFAFTSAKDFSSVSLDSLVT